MSQILLGQSYYLKFDPKLWKAMQPYPPLGTLYAASYLREKGYDVALFDAMLAESEDAWAQALDFHKPEYAIIYEPPASTFARSTWAARALSRRRRPARN